MTRHTHAPEAVLQRAVVEYLAYLEKSGAGLTCAHIPNEGKRSPRAGAEMKRQGLRPGMPDLVIWLRGGRVLHIELKSATGKPTPQQIAFGERMTGLGHRYDVVKAATVGEAIKKIDAILAEMTKQEKQGG